MKHSIAVVGSAHLDVIADSEDTTLDRPGTVRYSIGGSAYNMAVNLARAGRVTYMVTVLKQHSILTPLILSKLHRSGIDTGYVRKIAGLERDAAVKGSDLRAGGFVAHRRGGDLTGGVTDCVIEKLQFAENSMEWQLVRGAVNRCTTAVVDSNLNASGVCAVLTIAKRGNRPVVLAAVSERKIRNIVNVRGITEAAFAVCANELEIASLDEDFAEKKDPSRRKREATAFLDGKLADPDFGPRLCKMLHARAVAVTRGKMGAVILFEEGGSFVLSAPAVNSVVSTTGAGDAFCAVVAAHVDQTQRPLSNDKETINSLANLVNQIVAPVLGEPMASHGASLELDDDERKRAAGWIGRITTSLRDLLIEQAYSKGPGVIARGVLYVGAIVIVLLTPIRDHIIAFVKGLLHQ